MHWLIWNMKSKVHHVLICLMDVRVLFLGFLDKPTVTASQRHIHTGERCNYGANEMEQRTTPPLHPLPSTPGTKHTMMMWSVSITHYWREITVHQIIITRYFLTIFLCESFEKIVTVAGSLLELL